MSQDKKIKIGLILNKIATAMFIIFAFDSVVMFSIIPGIFYFGIMGVSGVIFMICTIISHIYLKDYRPDREDIK